MVGQDGLPPDPAADRSPEFSSFFFFYLSLDKQLRWECTQRPDQDESC